MARSIGWVQVREFYHGEIMAGEPQMSDDAHAFARSIRRRRRRLSPCGTTRTRTPRRSSALHALTDTAEARFPALERRPVERRAFRKGHGRAVPRARRTRHRRPLAARVRARQSRRARPGGAAVAGLHRHAGRPLLLAFRSGPLAALVMDTGEDKPDDSPYFGGMARVSDDAAASRPNGSRHRARSRGSAMRRTRCSSATSRSGSSRDIFPEHQRWECHDVCRDALGCRPWSRPV